MASLIQVDQRKWPDKEHWQFDARTLGDDEFGSWLHVPTGTTVRKGTEVPFRFRTGFVVCVPSEEWWIVEFLTDHPEITVYVNIGTPPVWNGARLTQVDLDVDVVRRLDGTVAIVDEDEFEEHQVLYDYPRELVSGANEAADRAVGLIRERAEPFGEAAQLWLSRVDPVSLRRVE